ncbi:YaiO family outer membrane beta-barrel protein [Rubritalea tangerina]|uniref:YaiO family outer membrane beta-barrel protein n=1 Tax=Rubritalea tangerina TaxID=430798 RepID=A0ABW4ZE54_9BACT
MQSYYPIVLTAFVGSLTSVFSQVTSETYVERKSQEYLTNQARKEAVAGTQVDQADTSGKMVLEEKPFRRWTVVPSYSHTFFNKGREDWQRATLDMFYQPRKDLLLGGSVDYLSRPPNDDDVVYSLNASWYPLKKLEVHGEVSYTPDANFMPNNKYTAGFQYIINSQFTALLDVDQLYFDLKNSDEDYDLTQIKPGVVWWFTEESNVTLRYAYGWVHNEVDYDYYSAALNYGELPRDGQLTLGFAYGTDPELDLGAPGALLSDAYIGTLFYREPIKPNLSVFAGVEYVYRLRPNSDEELYQSITPTIGLVWKF